MEIKEMISELEREKELHEEIIKSEESKIIEIEASIEQLENLKTTLETSETKPLMSIVPKIKVPKKTKFKIVAKTKTNIDKFIKSNYKTHTDKEIVEIIKEESGEKYSYDYIKKRRQNLGLKKPKGNFKGNIKPSETKIWTKDKISWLRKNVNEYENFDVCVDEFNEEFDLNVSEAAIRAQLSLNKIRRIRRVKPKIEKPVEIKTPAMIQEEKKEIQKRKGMSKEAVEIIEDNYMKKSDDELREMIADKTGQFFPADKIQNYRETNGMMKPSNWDGNDYEDDDE